MEDVKDWWDSETGSIEVRCSRKDTIMAYGLEKDLLELLDEIAEKLGFRIVLARTTTDLLALPAFLAVVNPLVHAARYWKRHFVFIEMYLGAEDCRYLFVSDHSGIQMPGALESMQICTPLGSGKTELNSLILQARAFEPYNLSTI